MLNLKNSSFNPLLLVTLLLSLVTVGCGGGHWDPAPDTVDPVVIPTVASTLPDNAAVDVAVNFTPSVTFSQAMDPDTIDETTFLLTGPDNASVAGDVVLVGNTATFTPDVALSHATLYTARVTTGAEATTGEPLASDVSWSFETLAALVMPTVESTLPAANAENVPVNTALTMVFSQPMDAATLNDANFTLAGPDAVAVPGEFLYTANGNTLMFTPDAPLAFSTLYTATLTTDASDTLDQPLATNFVWSFETAAQLIAPTVQSTTPADDDVNVPINTTVTVVFSQPMNPATLNDANFTLVGPDTLAVAGDFEYNAMSNTLLFTPLVALAPNSLYTATVTTAAADTLGETLANDVVWSFETATLLIAPTVESTDPADDDVNVPINTTLTIVFSQPMDSATLNDGNFNLVGPDTLEVDGDFEYNLMTNTLLFTPLQSLDYDSLYTATLTTGASDSLGETLENDVVWSFETAGAPDLVAPEVSLASPNASASAVCSNKLIQATFTEAMDPLTLASPMTSFTLVTTLGAMTVSGQVTLDATNMIATFTPDAALTDGTEYTATVSTDAEDLAGNGLAVNEVWSFTVGSAVCQETIVLDKTSTYSVLSNTGVTLGGGPNSVTGFRIIGNVGIYPAGACVGCDTTTVNGLIEIGTVPAQDAMTELTAIYDEAVGRTTGVCTLIGSGSLVTNPSAACGGGADGIFTPGLYWSASSIAIPAGGTITLDAQNDADAVFIFQSESTIDTIGGDTHIILANQAQAKNVFWVAKSSATIGGTNSDFAGTVLALVAVTVNEGTQMVGRAFARTAAVTVQDNADVTVPAP